MSSKNRKRKPPAGPAGGIPRDMIMRWLPWGAAALFLLFGIYEFNEQPSLSGDNAQFMVLGQSVAMGKGLSHINEGTPSPHTKYPFLFPVMLGGIHLLFPFSWVAPKVLVLLLGVFGTYFLARVLLREYPVPIALSAIALTVVSPEILKYSHFVLSEVPYYFVSFVALFFYSRWRQHERKLDLAIAFLLAIVSYYTRTIGITLVLAIIVSEVLQKRVRMSAILLVAFVALAAPWAMRNQAVGTGDSYASQFLRSNPYDFESPQLTPVELVTVRMKENIRKYVTKEYPIGVLTWYQTIPGLPPLAAGVIISLLTLFGLARALGQHRDILAVYAAVYIGVCLVWPEVWASLRFLVPLLPLLLLFLLLGVDGLFSFASRAPWRAWVVPATAAALVIPALMTNVRLANAPQSYPANWRNYFAIADYARESTDPDALIIARKPYLFYLRSQRKTQVYLWSYDRDKVFRDFVENDVDYVVISQLSGDRIEIPDSDDSGASRVFRADRGSAGSPNVAAQADKGLVLKVLVTTIYYPPRLGGIENHVYYLCRGLVQRGVETSIVTSRTEPGSLEQEEEPGYRVRRVPLPGRNALGWIVNAALSLGPANRWGRDADIIHAHTFQSVLPVLPTKRKRKIPLVVTIHSSHFLKMVPKPHWRFVFKKLLGPADLILATSVELADRCREILPDTRVHEIVNGIDTDLFQPVTPTIERRNGRKILVTTRRLVEKKRRTISDRRDAGHSREDACRPLSGRHRTRARGSRRPHRALRDRRPCTLSRRCRESQVARYSECGGRRRDSVTHGSHLSFGTRGDVV